MLVLVLAAVLRFRGLEVQSLWHDELFVVHAVRHDTLAAAIRVGAAEDVHPPGYIAMMYAWTRMFGDSVAALRLPSVLAGIVAVGWIAQLGEVWLSRRVGLIAAALTAVAWMPLYYSQEARPYALLFLGVVVLAERLTALVRAPRPATAAVVLIVAVWLSYLHYFGLLFVGLAFVAWGGHTLVSGQGRRLWAAVSVATVVGLIPWFSRLKHQVDRGEIWIPEPTPAAVWELYGSMANGSTLGLLLVLLAGAASARSPSRAAVGTLVAWATVPVAAALVVSWLVLPVMTDRNLIIVLPAVLLLVALALAQLDRWFRDLPVASAAMVALLLADLHLVRDYYHTPTKWQYREVAEVIAQEAPTGDVLVVSGAWHADYFDYWFEQLEAPVRVDVTASRPKQIQAAASEAAAPVVFVAVPISGPRRPRGTLQMTGYELSWTRPFIGWDLYRFERPWP